MWKLLRRRRPVDLDRVIFCERCGEVCDARCRADALRERAKADAMAFRTGWR